MNGSKRFCWKIHSVRIGAIDVKRVEKQVHPSGTLQKFTRQLNGEFNLTYYQTATITLEAKALSNYKHRRTLYVDGFDVVVFDSINQFNCIVFDVRSNLIVQLRMVATA